MTADALRVGGLAKEFGGLRAVDNVSLTVGAGERRVLIGPNGAGKTTLFHCITGTLRPSAGEVALFGREITRLAEPRRTALGMSRTFQISNVFADLAVIENMILALLGTDRRKWILHRPVGAFGALRARAMDGLARVGLEDRADAPARMLSYGERRQLELALALNTNPRVLLLDEPCAGLSPGERQKISQAIARLPRAITLVMIEHDMDVALGLADRVTVMHRGKVILEGSPGEAQANPQVREVYFGHV
jgi:branched-chain amino acid transport system ATP-binding protein